MFEILLKKWKSWRSYPFFQCHTTALPTLHQALEDTKTFHWLQWIFCCWFFFMKFFSVQFLGKDGFLNCSGESCFSGTFNLVYFCMAPRGASVSVPCSAQPALFAPAVQTPNKKCCDLMPGGTKCLDIT